MSKKTGPTNAHLRRLIVELKKTSRKEKASIWKDVAEKLAKPRRRKIEVNISDINRNARAGETVVIPGVVMAAGELKKEVNVAAWRFTATAKKKIEDANGKTLTIEELVEKNPKGSKVRILV